MSAVLGVVHSAVDFAVPAGATDCHVHLFGPFERFPLATDRKYTPGPASVEDLLVLHRALHVERVVIVQASPQGTDNACLADSMRRLQAAGHAARGVAVIDDKTSDRELDALHIAGVRGVRVNLESVGQHDPKVAERQLRSAAARAAPLGWHVQTYTTLPVIRSLHDVIMQLPVPLVIDHFGRVPAAGGTAQAGFDALLALVKSGKAYVKLSAAQRISDLPDCADAGPIARALIAANPDRMLWGTDWPHPGGQPGATRGVTRSADAIEPFNAIDDGNALNRLAKWTDAEGLRRILVDNPARLYEF